MKQRPVKLNKTSLEIPIVIKLREKKSSFVLHYF